MIKILNGANDTGAYRASLNLLLRELDKAGGLPSIVPFSETKSGNRRAYTSATDSNAMKMYTESNSTNAKILGVDIYCDGKILSSSGTQSANTVRIRFSNIRARSNKWHDVGIAPILLDEDQVLTRTQREKERLQFFQRFLYVAFRDLMDASASGIFYKGELLLPPIMNVVADQPQERLFYCLKGSQSFRDCSLCELISEFPKSLSQSTLDFVSLSDQEDTGSAEGTDRDVSGLQEEQCAIRI